MLKRMLLAALEIMLLALVTAGCSSSARGNSAPTITALSIPTSSPVQPEEAAATAPPVAASPATKPPVLKVAPPQLEPTRPALDPACLVGLWEAADLPAAMAESFRGTASGLTLQGIEGRVLYRFEPDGRFTIQFDQLTATLTGTLDERAVTARQALNGHATARYDVLSAEEELLLSTFGGEGIEFSLDINDQRLAEGNLPAWRAFTSTLSDGSMLTPGPLMEHARAEAACAGDTMRLRTVDPEVGPEVLLRRVQE